MSENEKMLPIWFFVGLMLIMVGIIVTATGINYLFNPQDKTVLAHLNPNLWWGAIILVLGLLFFIPTLIRHRKDQAGRS